LSTQSKIILENETEFSIPIEKLSLMAEVVLHNRFNEIQTINLIITDSKRMIRMNRQYRGVNNTTDVLSFPSGQNFLPILGDIIIDLQVCIAQSTTKNWQDELLKLFLHGILHLLGYEHISNVQKANMESLENKYWNKFKENNI
jgi:probable rRNA maturation factor